MSRKDAPESRRLAFVTGVTRIVAGALFVLGAIAFLAVLPCLTAAHLIPDHARAGAVQNLGIVAGAVGLLCWSLCGVLRLRLPRE
jgi:drug/metabolite transporter (DMT)-like permease